MSGPALTDQAQRDRLVRELDSSLFVEAGAGTGKTTAVVSRIVALVRAGRLRMERLVAITFTVAAAAELRVRVREGLEREARAAADGPERERVHAGASEVERARIETIHAFSSALLRMHPLEAGLPPDFQVLANLSEEADVRERFRRWFDGLTPGTAGGESVRRALLLGLRPNDLLELFTAFNGNWDLMAQAGWPAGQLPAAERTRAIGEGLTACLGLMSSCRDPEDRLHRELGKLPLVAARLSAAQGDEEALAALRALSLPPANAGDKRLWGNVDGANACEHIKKEMNDLRPKVDELLGSARASALAGVCRELRDLVLSYAEERRSRGLVSYQDLLVRARDLVRDHPDVRRALHHRWDLIAVDEFQDTDPLQAELAFRLSADADAPMAQWHRLDVRPGRLCLVGDPQQAIYRFRRADIGLYSAAATNLVGSHPGALVPLSVNFRSGRRIIDTVNDVFGGEGGLMARGGSTVQAPYRDLVAHAPGVDGTVSIFGGAIGDRAPVMWGEEARAAARLVGGILDQGWTVGEGTPEGPRRCRPGDICILMPSRTNLRRLERELEAAGLDLRLESGSLIIATQEVRDLLNILRSLDDPTDEVALVAALRSPGFGCSDVDLVRWRAGGGRWSYLRPGAGGQPGVADSLADLRALHEGRHRMSVPRLIDEVLSSRLLRAAAYGDRRPRETLRRYRFVSDRARTLARGARPTLHEAVEYLERLARDPTYEDVVTEDEGTDSESCVRVMTVHGAKGLEFPVVIVTGLGRKASSKKPVVAVDRLTGAVEVRAREQFETPGWQALAAHETAMEDAERDRLLYVALTRARDHLVVGLFRAESRGDETDAGRLDPLLRGRPGVEDLEIPPPRGEPAPLAAAASDPTPDEHRAVEEVWLRRREETLTTRAGEAAVTATGLAHAGEEAGVPPERGEDVASSRRGRAATSVGRAVHATLQVVGLADPGELDVVARAEAAAEGIPERAGDVADLVRAAWASEPVRRAAGLRHWREVPLGAPVDGVLLEGFVDLLYEEPDGRLVVVDYKTDSVRGAGIDTRARRYRLQAGVYALLVALVAGRGVARIELVFADPGTTRTIADVEEVVAEVRAALRGTSWPDPFGSDSPA